MPLQKLGFNQKSGLLFITISSVNPPIIAPVLLGNLYFPKQSRLLYVPPRCFHPPTHPTYTIPHHHPVYQLHVCNVILPIQTDICSHLFCVPIREGYTTLPLLRHCKRSRVLVPQTDVTPLLHLKQQYYTNGLVRLSLLRRLLRSDFLLCCGVFVMES